MEAVSRNNRMIRRVKPYLFVLPMTALALLFVYYPFVKTVLYSLDPADNAQIDAITGCFACAEARGKVQHGSAWWFSDTKKGMEEHLKNLASMSVLANFIGMVTDSRSFLSYTRHEYFRRILCSLLGDWIENGEYPADIAAVGSAVRDICYNNAMRYFGAE